MIYTPTLDFSGIDTIIYVASDGTLTDTATITITIDPVDDPPTARPDSFDVTYNTALLVNTPGVLANDSDDDSESMAAALISGPK